MRNAYKIFVGKPEGKRPFGRHRHRCEDTRIDVMEIGCEVRDWTRLDQVRA
jgi:hypothetical protein